MHYPLFTALILATLLPIFGNADQYQPESVATADFAALIKQSPFIRTLNVSGSLIITGIAEIEGQQVATLLDTETKETYFISATPNSQGWKMLELKPDSDLEKVTAKISIAGQVISVRYAKTKMKPGETHPGGGSPSARTAAPKTSQPNGPSDSTRKQLGALSTEQREKFGRKMRELREKNPDMSVEDRTNVAKRLLQKLSKKER